MEVVNLQKACRILGVKPRTIYNRVHKQTLKAYKDHRGRLVFDRKDLTADLSRVSPRKPRRKVAV